MTKLSYHENEFCEYWIDEHGVVHEIFKDTFKTLNLEIAMVITRDRLKVTNGVARPLYVELGKHTKSEVIKQIDTFRNCSYTVENANYIYRKKQSAFNLAQLTNLVTKTSPELMVIVNEFKKDWKKDLLRFNCKMCVFQIYNDFDGNRLYRLNGEHPFIYTNFSECTYEKMLPYMVKILKT